MGNELYVVDLSLQATPATRIHMQQSLFEFGLSFSGIPEQNSGSPMNFRRGIKIFQTIHRTIQIPDTDICIESTSNATGSAASSGDAFSPIYGSHKP